MTDRIVNINDIALEPFPPGMAPEGEAAEKYGATMGSISRALGAEKLGCNITCVEPGKSAFPYHHHRVNEEMFLMLEGEGELRLGGERHPLVEGDVIACPPGGPETAHQIINTGDKPLRFLAISTRLTPEIAEYPDSGKFGVMAQFGTGESAEMFLHMGRRDQNLPYWD